MAIAIVFFCPPLTFISKNYIGIVTDYYRSDVITTAELEAALAMLKDVSGEAKIQSLVRVLDEDHDGNINLEELGEVRERGKGLIIIAGATSAQQILYKHRPTYIMPNILE